MGDYFIVFVICFPLFNFFLTSLGGYHSMRFRSPLSFLRLSAGVSGAVFLCASALLFVLNLDLSRSFLATFCLIVFVALFLERSVVLGLLRAFRVRGKNFRNLLIVGTGEQAQKIYNEILESPELGIKVSGFVEPSARHYRNLPGKRVNQVFSPEAESVVENYLSQEIASRVIADRDSYEETLKKYAIDEVLFTDTERYYRVVQNMASIAVDEGITVSFSALIFGFDISRSGISYFGKTPLVHLESTPTSMMPLAIKRTIDLLGSSLGIILLSPACFLLGLMLKIDSKGPVFFKQKRVGLNGRLFTLYKFRSMYTDAESRLAELRDSNEMDGPVFKIKNDPRITRVGKFTRKFSIDELPQLWNVFRGDMSLVGPRPPLPSEVEKYKRKQRRRLSMRPGITCTWQVSGRNKILSFEEWTELDLAYIDNWSLGRDFNILARTIPAVLSGRGAA
jgi:exopolysaccharide biosynthesis polyprenyl glycosylphosphotransferase